MSSFRRFLSTLVAVAVAVSGIGIAVAAELDGPASIVYDQYRVPTVVAQTEHDAIFLQGYLHARDRFFQMDFLRKVFSGRVAELVGPDGIPQDVQLRTLGVRRAAERSLAVQTPEVLDWLQAYSDGVNAFLASSEPLPLEYFFLEIDRDGIDPWTPTDSLTMAKGLAFNLSFDLGDIDRTLALLTFLGTCPLMGCNGLQLLQDDLWRTAPFEPAGSIPPSPPPPGQGGGEPTPPDEELAPHFSDPNFESLVRSYRNEIADIPLLRHALESDFTAEGSNWWVVSGALTESGYPMIANDPHLSLGTPATFYENHLNVTGGINVTGVSFPGAPGVVLGCNDTICWGATVNAIDATDVYQEVLLALGPDPTQPTHTLFDGAPEPLQFIPQTFLFNVIGDGVLNDTFNAGVPPTSGGVTLVVPRRNDGPIVQVSFDPGSPTPLTGISVQYVGWAPTQELETFRRFARATSMQEFKDALQYFDFGSQNWSYADVNGNIAYYTSGELPIREDLQNLLFPAGLNPPSLIRNGAHTVPHEWMAVVHPQPHQSLDREILPFAEMPQIENPPAGYILNANNDPIGTTFGNVPWTRFRAGFNGRLYLSSGYAPGFRQGRIQRLFDSLLAGGGKVSQLESIQVQANNQLLDAEILSPYLLDAYANATAPGAPSVLTDIVSDSRIGDAIGRIAAWNFSTPTGINEGFDPFDNPLAPGPPTAAEVDASIAATIYSTWRGQFVHRVIDQTLANLPIPLDGYAPGSAQSMAAVRLLLENYPLTGGTGSSLINFFSVPGVPDQNVARDIIILESLQNALDLLASSEMAPAFGNSTDLTDYRWGKLHRIVYSHFLGAAFSIPPAGSPLNLAPDLPGLSRAGGMGSVDAASHSARADGLNEFMFDSGPSRRLIATLAPSGPEVLEVIPGGESGHPGSPQQSDQLFLWLVNAYKSLPVDLQGVLDLAVETESITCGDGVVGPGEACDDGNTNNADGCNTSCMLSSVISCAAPAVPADALTCSATVSCDAIASCVDAAGAAVSVGCAPDSGYTAGTTSVTVTCGDPADMIVATCPVTVVDVTPPTLSVALAPDQLWPPNHRMVDVAATPAAADACGAATVTLSSIGSDELDNGAGDGDTDDDIQGGDVGSGDLGFQLRAERSGLGTGRTYTVVYTATDAAGNQTSAEASVFVPHDQGGVVEPILMTLSETAAGTALNWTHWPNSTDYNVVRGNLAELRDLGPVYDFGSVTCIEGASPNENTDGDEDAAIPAPGEAFFYLIEFDANDGRSEYGTVSAAKPRYARSGDCH